jgi:(S)-mandelate dehydrogenase
MARLAAAVTIEDLRVLARRRLPDFVFGPMETGAGVGDGSARNVRRLRERLLLPRALVDLQLGSPASVELLGSKYASPFGISAIGYAGNFRRGADELLAQAAVAADVPFLLSGASNQSVETIAKISTQHVWFQLYGAKDPARTDHMVGRARDSGINVLVVTVDFPLPPRIERTLRSGVRLPALVETRAIPYVLWEMLKHPAWTLDFVRHGGAPRLENWSPYVAARAGAADVARDFASQIPSNQTWADLERIRRQWPGKLVVKGLMHPGDALRAAELGADAVIVSNHGSVKLDSLPATIDVLPAVVNALKGRIPVLFDGGIRSGHDIVVAQCLGAAFCFCGRAVLYGLIGAGRPGADHALAILKEELHQTMAMIGCARSADLGPQFLFDERADALPPQGAAG